MYHNFLIHSSANGHLGCFHVLAIVNRDVMNTAVHVCLSILVSSVCIPSCGIAGSLVQFICSVVSDSLQPHGLQPTRLLHPWDSPGKSTGMGSIVFSLWHSNPTSGHIHQGNQYWERHVYPNVHRSTVYNSQDMEATYMSISRQMDIKLWYIYTMEYYSAIKKNAFESVLMRWMKLELICRVK